MRWLHETACGTLSLALALGVGCRTYQPRPLDAVNTEAHLRERTLDDPGLRAYIAEHLPEGQAAAPSPAWDLTRLTLVAFYYHPDLDVARASLGSAEAAIVTAGARPNPSVGVAPGYEDAPESPWLYGVTFDIPIETAGKRGHRVARARHLGDATRLELAQTAWRVRSRVRAALADDLLAVRALDLWQAEEKLRTDAVRLMADRLAVGEVSRPDVDTARADLLRTTLAVQAARGEIAGARSALATALGLPLAALDGATLAWAELEAPPTTDALAAAAVQRAGLLNRLDVRRSLAEYAAAEAALQLEVAKQYPDLHVGPSYAFDDGANKYKLGVTVTLPVLNRNEGPIAEAEAHRTQAAAQFLALQAQVIGETERALAGYRAARAELDTAEKLLAVLNDRAKMTRLAVEVGEMDRLALTDLEVQRAIVARARLDALRKTQTALGTLEDAVQRPLDSALTVPELPKGGGREMLPRAWDRP